MKKVILILFLHLMLCGCGFKPMYQNLHNITIHQIKFKSKIDPAQQDHVKEIVNNYLASYQGADDDSASYYLDLEFDITSIPALIQKNATTSRFTVQIVTDYVLYNRQNQIVIKDQVSLVDSYDINYNLYSNFVTDQKMRMRLTQTMIEELINLIQSSYR